MENLHDELRIVAVGIVELSLSFIEDVFKI